MPSNCEIIKTDQAGKLSNPAKILLAYMRAAGITDAKQLSTELNIPIRTIQRLKLECASVVDSNANSAKDAIYGAPKTPNAPDMAFSDAPNAPDMAPLARANKESPSEISSILENKQTDSHTVSQSVCLPPAELKQAFNGSTENLIRDIQRWMGADRGHAVKWLTTTLSAAGADAVLAAYGQLLESQTKGKLIADPIRYLAKTSVSLKGRTTTSSRTGRPEAVHVVSPDTVRYAKPVFDDEVAHA